MENIIKWISGNPLNLAIPLQKVTITKEGKVVEPYLIHEGDVVTVKLRNNAAYWKEYDYTPEVVDGSVLTISDFGEICAGSYSITILVTEYDGTPRRSKWNYVLEVYDSNDHVLDAFDDFPDYGSGEVIDASVFYFAKSGEGVPKGGSRGAVLVKRSDADYDTEWDDSRAGVLSVNGKSGIVDLGASDVGALPDDTTLFSGSYNDLLDKPTIPTALSQLSEDATHRTVSDTEKTTWGNKQEPLVSGTNIKTINNESVLGSGNINIITELPSNLSYISNDDGDGIIPSDGIHADSLNAGATMTINPDVVTVINGAVGTAAITLQVPNDNLAHVWDILMTTDSSVAITFAMSNSETILYPNGFSVGASKAVEVSVIGVGTKYYLRYGEFA